MTDAPRYWTQEFADRFVETLEQDPAFQKAARGFADTVVLQCLDTPDGKDVRARYAIDRGRVTLDYQAFDAPAAEVRQAPFDKKGALARTTAPYALWTRLDRGEMNVLQAIASPDYRVEGPKLKIMSNVGLFNAMNAVAARIPKSY